MSFNLRSNHVSTKIYPIRNYKPAEGIIVCELQYGFFTIEFYRRKINAFRKVTTF